MISTPYFHSIVKIPKPGTPWQRLEPRARSTSACTSADITAEILFTQEKEGPNQANIKRRGEDCVPVYKLTNLRTTSSARPHTATGLSRKPGKEKGKDTGQIEHEIVIKGFLREVKLPWVGDPLLLSITSAETERQAGLLWPLRS